MHSTLSPEALALIEGFADLSSLPDVPDIEDIEAWDAQNKDYVAGISEKNEKVRADYQVITQRIYLGDQSVPVLEINPPNLKTEEKILIHLHGGCYTFFSAETTIVSSIPVAFESGLKVLSIDYTLAPRAKWRQVYSEIEMVIRAIVSQGISPSNMAIFGESAGGALAAGTALMMEENGIGRPAALCLLSPWSDIDKIGDSYYTHADLEVAYNYERHLARCALAYAAPEDFKHPWVSPVYADYAADFPPTLIQGGTREIFLSNFMRHHQALEQAGAEVELDLYEGMPHAFWALGPEVPESKTARRKAVKFILSKLNLL